MLLYRVAGGASKEAKFMPKVIRLHNINFFTFRQW